MLLIVLLTLALATVLIAPLATFSGVEALTTAYRADTLRHRLAAESVVAMLPELLEQDRRLGRELDGGNRAVLTFALADVHVTVLLQDDTAKLPLQRLFETRDVTHVRDALELLKTGAGLPALELLPIPTARNAQELNVLRWTGCLDDLFVVPTDAALFATPNTPSAWTQCITPLSGVVNVRRAAAAVLEALLSDWQSGIGDSLADIRERQPDATIDELLSALELTGEAAAAVRQRLTQETQRYSLLIRTQIDGDSRQRYVICSAAEPPRVLVNWEVAP